MVLIILIFFVCFASIEKTHSQLEEFNQELNKQIFHTSTVESACGEGLSHISKFPWMMAIFLTELRNGIKRNVFQCGGSLIHPQVVLTAAHCVADKTKEYLIRAGEHDIHNANEIYAHQDRELETILLHPKYSGKILINDVALLYLKTPVEITQFVDVICLPPQRYDVDSELCTATGWGQTDNGEFSNVLQKVDLPLIPKDVCEDKLRQNKRLPKATYLHKSFICAGDTPTKGTCKGDDGGPLVCPIPNTFGRYYQVGVIGSTHNKCGRENTPGVHVKVAVFKDWIDEQMKQFNLQSSYYEY